MSSQKVVKGSLFMMIGYFIFRIGGYIYRLLMALLLGSTGYGILGITLAFQGILQTLSAGGMPPAIAKYVSEKVALNKNQEATQIVITALKVMTFLGIMFSLIILFSGEWLAINIFHNKLAQYPIQAVALITPFSVIVGAFRGAFQGVYKMEYVVASRAVEQVFMIVMAVVLVILGFYAVGAVIGTAIGFMASSIASYLIFKKYLTALFPPISPENKLSFAEELQLSKKLLSFSIPVIITSLSEMAIYDVSPLVIGFFMTLAHVGYYTSADPIARLPLVISLSVSSTLLPAASEAYALKNKKSLENYVVQSYRYVILLVLPVCVGIGVFAKPLLSLLFPTIFAESLSAINEASMALSILVFGMSFYTLFMISSSISQGIGHPKPPMYILIMGTVINIILNLAMVPYLGLLGGALATTISAFIIMVVMIYKTFKLTDVKVPYVSFMKIFTAALIMGLSIIILPNTILGLIIAIFIASVVYLTALILLKTFNEADVQNLYKFSSKVEAIKPLHNVLKKIIYLIEKNLQ